MNITHISQTNFCVRSEIGAGYESPENICFYFAFCSFCKKTNNVGRYFQTEVFQIWLKKLQYSFHVRTDIIQQIRYKTVRLWTARLQTTS
jgi:hypothetical protein